MPTLSRRTLLRLTAAGLWVPPALAGPLPSEGERKFLIVLARGGWDVLRVFTPMAASTGYAVDAEGVEVEANGITWLSSPSRPAVDTFFQTWGDRVCVVNGVEIPSLSHDVCLRLLLTGRSDAAGDDWGCVLGAASEMPDLLLPYLVFDGPSYTRLHPDALVRLGDTGQLPLLLSGDIFTRSSTPIRGMDASAEAIADAFLAARAEAWAEAATCGQRAYLGERYTRALSDIRALATEAESLNLTADGLSCSRDLEADAEVVIDCMAAGLARVALLQDSGDCVAGWDTHSNDGAQEASFQSLFEKLGRILAMLEERTSASGAPLAEEVTVVVLSEMGRTPFLNRDAGRDHWTYTSAMLIGAGVRGGQVIGGMNDGFLGERVSLTTGALDDQGTALTATHLGATLLELGGVDPARYLDVSPLEAALA